jgi:two-component system chemotaxis response regulator CheB
MKFDSRYYLKWINAQDSYIKDCDFTFVNLCIVLAKDVAGKAKGMTVFEPKSFGEDFCQRLERRVESDPSVKYEIYLPPFLKHKTEKMTAALSAPNVKLSFTPFVGLKETNGQFYVRTQLRVVSVDDSPVLLKLLKNSMQSLGHFDVVSQISDPHTAIAAIRRLKPDLLTFDIQMPGKTGVDLVRELLAVEYYPILMISSLELREGSLVFEALNEGAFDYIQKPRMEEMQTFLEDLSQKSLLAIEGRHARQALKNMKKETRLSGPFSYPANMLWCLGASTGGTQALTQVFTSLPSHIPPTFVVQHIPPIFSKAFAEALNNLCPFTVKEAEHDEVAQADHVYVAPGGTQMGVQHRQGQLRIVISDAAPVNRFKPSVDYLFNEVAKLTKFQMVAGLLTGMGKDGAQGLLTLKNAGARTFAQNEATSIVYGMPRAAIEIGAAEEAVSLDKVAETLIKKTTQAKKSA